MSQLRILFPGKILNEIEVLNILFIESISLVNKLVDFSNKNHDHSKVNDMISGFNELHEQLAENDSLYFSELLRLDRKINNYLRQRTTRESVNDAAGSFWKRHPFQKRH